jgi:glutathione synthase/RimK-type ligase-like ATP-grasp enzyme
MMPRGKAGLMVSFRIDPDIAAAIKSIMEKRGMDRTQVLCQGFLMAFRDDIIGVVGVEVYATWMSAATSGMEND